MPHTHAWSDTTPLGSDQAASIDNHMRDLKLDVHERMDVDHVFGTDQTHDGKHQKITLRPADDTVEFASETAGTTTGTGTSGLMNLAKALNGSGIVDVIKVAVNVISTSASSTFLRLLAGSGTTELVRLGLDGAWNFFDNLLARPFFKDYAEAIQTPAIGATTTFDFENGNVARLQLTQNTTVAFTNPPISGRCGSMVLELRQDATGGRTVSWPASVKWPAGVTPTMTTTANKKDLYFVQTVDGGTTYQAGVIGQSYD